MIVTARPVIVPDFTAIACGIELECPVIAHIHPEITALPPAGSFDRQAPRHQHRLCECGAEYSGLGVDDHSSSLRIALTTHIAISESTVRQTCPSHPPMQNLDAGRPETVRGGGFGPDTTVSASPRLILLTRSIAGVSHLVVGIDIAATGFHS